MRFTRDQLEVLDSILDAIGGTFQRNGVQLIEVTAGSIVVNDVEEMALFVKHPNVTYEIPLIVGEPDMGTGDYALINSNNEHYTVSEILAAIIASLFHYVADTDDTMRQLEAISKIDI